MSDWIEWKGGDQPVSDETKVEVEFADGEVQTARADDLKDISGDLMWNWWEHRDQAGWEDCYVVRYRIAE